MPAARYDADKVDASVLGEKITLPTSGQVAKSRFLKAAMTERLCTWDQHDISKRGKVTEELIEVYRRWGQGGYGIVLSGNLLVDAESLEAPGNIIVVRESFSDDHRKQLKKLIDASKADGSLFIAQLSHAGRQVADFINPNPISASDVALGSVMGMNFAKPRPATQEDIDRVVDQFAYAAEELYKLGADGVQLHAAHGYLLAQFLSPTTNQRTDKYGGSIENRSRLIFDIFAEIEKRVKDKKFSLSIKLNSVEFQEAGFTPEDAAKVCQKLESTGVDWVELSGGTYQSLAFSHKRESTKKREAFFLEFAELIRNSLSAERKLSLWVTGGFRTTAAMVEAVKSGATDGVGLARPATSDFATPKTILNGAVSVVKPLLDENDFGITNVASGVQIRQVGKGLRPFNISDEKEVGAFQETVGAFFAKMGENAKKGIVEAGYPDLAGSAYQ